MTRPTRNRPASLFTATAADLPLFSGTCQRAEAQQYTPREQPQQANMFDRREYIDNPAEYHRKQVAKITAKMPDAIKGVFELEPETNAEARQQDSDTDDAPKPDSHFDEVLDRTSKKEPGRERAEYIRRSVVSGYISNVEAGIIEIKLGKKKAKK